MSGRPVPVRSRPAPAGDTTVGSAARAVAVHPVGPHPHLVVPTARRVVPTADPVVPTARRAVPTVPSKEPRP